MPVSRPHRYGAVLRASANQQSVSHGFGAGVGAAQPMGFCHSHGDLELNYVYSGKPRYLLKDREFDLSEGTLCAFWAAVPHQVVALAPGTRFMWMHVPLTVLLRWNLDPSFMGRIFAGELIIDRSGLAWDDELTRRWLRDLSTYEADLVRTVEIEVEARVRRLSSKQHQLAELGESKRNQPIATMTSYLIEHFRQDISAADVAGAAGLNRHYAMRLFKKESGLSIWQYLLRLRVSHAQHMLLTTDAPVVSVGLDSGFGSASRFYEIFTRECKMSPAEYRRSASGGVKQAVPA